VASGLLKDIYTISAIAANAAGPCSDATKLYVYNQNALKIMVTDAAGAQADMTGGTLTLSNQNQIASLYNTGGSAAVLGLQRDISLVSHPEGI